MSFGDDTLSKARRIEFDGIMVVAKWVGLLLGAVAGVLVGAQFGWFPAIVAGYFGWNCGGSIGGGIAGVVAFHEIDREETGHAVGAIGFGIGAGAGAALGTVLLGGVSWYNLSGLWLGAFGGFAVGGALVGGLAARVFVRGIGWLPATMAVVTAGSAGLGAALAHVIGTRTPTVLAVIIGVVLIWGIGGMGKRLMTLDPLESRYQDDWPYDR